MVLFFVFSVGAIGAENNNDNDNGSQDIVQQTINLYDRGRINEAELLALKALDSAGNLSKSDSLSLHKVLAFCSIARDDIENGIRHFVSALTLNPTMTSDPITWSPKIRRVFTLAVDEYDAKIAVIRHTRQGLIAELCRNASLKSLYLPGSGQFMKEQPFRGTIYGVLFWSAAASFVYSQLVLPQYRNDYLDATNTVDAADAWEKYRNVYQLSAIAGVVTGTVYTITFFDALWFQPSVNFNLEFKP